MLKGVIFDHDGTLVDSEKKHFGLWQTLLTRYGIDFQESEYKTYLAGVPTFNNAEYLVAKYDLGISAQALFEQRELATNATLGEQACPLIAGAKPLVEWIDELGLAMAIATGASVREVKPTLTEHGFSRYFPIVASRDHVAHAKPAPDVYQYALDQMGLSAAQCIAIEDSPTGLRSAIACGIDCIVVQNDYSRGHDFTGALAVLDHMDEVREWVLQKL